MGFSQKQIGVRQEGRNNEGKFPTSANVGRIVKDGNWENSARDRELISRTFFNTLFKR
jgi:hypothetical protein